METRPLHLVVVLRADAAIRFPEGQGLAVKAFATASGPADFVFRTRYVAEGFDCDIPRELWVEVRGTAASLNSAIGSYWNAANNLLPILVLCANAASESLSLDLAFDETPDQNEHEYFQRFFPAQTGLMFEGRELDIAAALALITATARHSDSARLHRAMVQYFHALGHWQFGHDLLAVSHLFMAAETLTEVALRDILRTESLDERQLGERWNLKQKKSNFGNLLRAEVRRRVIFQNDDKCHKAAKAASDGFEHGFENLHSLRQKATESREMTAKYIREAIIHVLKLDSTVETILRAEKFSRPLGLTKYDRYLKGRLIGPAAQLAALPNEYPLVKWEWKIERAYRDDRGNYNFSPSQRITPMIGQGVTFQPLAVEVWGDPYQPRTNGRPPEISAARGETARADDRREEPRS